MKNRRNPELTLHSTRTPVHRTKRYLVSALCALCLGLSACAQETPTIPKAQAAPESTVVISTASIKTNDLDAGNWDSLIWQ